eukprot:jgi/Chrzof1/3230/Cz12g16240.t1
MLQLLTDSDLFMRPEWLHAAMPPCNKAPPTCQGLGSHSACADSFVRACPAADPAAEHFSYPVSIDIRDLISLEDVMEELQLGPNG